MGRDGEGGARGWRLGGGSWDELFVMVVARRLRARIPRTPMVPMRRAIILHVRGSEGLVALEDLGEGLELGGGGRGAGEDDLGPDVGLEALVVVEGAFLGAGFVSGLECKRRSVCDCCVGGESCEGVVWKGELR